ncbi:3-hydroxy-9,10-secoandrosta-1,3,5(10)-triene-9,17-dione monooxygenase [Thermosporothrix hazakensis]|jgi:3-hydroxy-9,10-secoandrosta-1,3,5(10)-triene-9,17-dione monooxygenase|uniref:3-hydroxy-9,10-secoandrosta-1,3,5(10)-triene-9, 17-dione monooxygenase n=2 Tax=Thermosporothrix TaxID=768650 RepID=A0A326UJL3_THEHA|nr:3-hydroxy-9,10-secoandrosta-1,3,5(10)-triene-9,17-dione monooxygenase [Thermosporothrix hazakensis]
MNGDPGALQASREAQPDTGDTAKDMTEAIDQEITDIVKGVQALLPIIQAHREQSEQQRKLAQEIVQAFLESRLVRLLMPAQWGGHELSLDALAATMTELARADASAGWCCSLYCIHSCLLALFPQQAQRDVWEAQPDTLLAASFAPHGTARQVKGGYQISGAWPWASGVDYCSWAILNAALGQDHPQGSAFFLVPRHDFLIEDTWHVCGLSGSGSKTIVLHEAFVPEYRQLPYTDFLSTHTPGSQLYTAPLYHLPHSIAFPIALIAPILGATTGAYEQWREALEEGQTLFTRQRVANLTHVQIRVAEISVQLDSARLLLQRGLDTIRTGGPFSSHQIARQQRDYAWIAHLCRQTVEQMYITSGGSAIFTSNPLQRYWRDVHAMTAHAVLNFETAGTRFGHLELDPMLH